MTLLDLMSIYQLQVNTQSLYAMLFRIMEDGELDSRVNRDLLCDLIVAECGAQTPRYNVTDVFIRFGAALLLKIKREITRDIDLFDAEYDQLREYDRTIIENTTDERTNTDRGTITRTPDLTEERTPDLTEERTPDLTEERTPDLTEERTPDLTEERTPDLTEERSDTAKNDGTTEHYVSADNQGNTLALRSKDVVKGEGRQTNTQTSGTETVKSTGTETVKSTGTETVKSTGTETVKSTGTETVKSTGTEQTENNLTKHDDYTHDMSRREYGRDTAAPKLFKDALDVNALNIYQIIIDKFSLEMLLSVY